MRRLRSTFCRLIERLPGLLVWSSSMAAAACHFLALPTEMRLLTYKHYFDRVPLRILTDTLHINTNTFALLRTCNQIYQEARSEVFWNPTLSFGSSEHMLFYLHALSDAKLRSVKHVSVRATPLAIDVHADFTDCTTFSLPDILNFITGLNLDTLTVLDCFHGPEAEEDGDAHDATYHAVTALIGRTYRWKELRFISESGKWLWDSRWEREPEHFRDCLAEREKLIRDKRGEAEVNVTSKELEVHLPDLHPSSPAHYSASAAAGSAHWTCAVDGSVDMFEIRQRSCNDIFGPYPALQTHASLGDPPNQLTASMKADLVSRAPYTRMASHEVDPDALDAVNWDWVVEDWAWSSMFRWQPIDRAYKERHRKTLAAQEKPKMPEGADARAHGGWPVQRILVVVRRATGVRVCTPEEALPHEVKELIAEHGWEGQRRAGRVVN